jgi:hypothetical protein
MSDRLILEIELADFNVDDVQAASDEWDIPVKEIVLEEMMRPEVGLTVVTIPGEKCLSDDFEVHAMNARIVGAHILSGNQQEEKP